MRIILDDTYFPLVDAGSNYQIYFPDDTSFNGRFFYVKKEYVEKNDNCIAISLDANTAISIIDEEKGEFTMQTWDELCLQLRRYMLQKIEEEKKNEDK